MGALAAGRPHRRRAGWGADRGPPRLRPLRRGDAVAQRGEPGQAEQPAFRAVGDLDGDAAGAKTRPAGRRRCSPPCRGRRRGCWPRPAGWRRGCRRRRRPASGAAGRRRLLRAARQARSRPASNSSASSASSATASRKTGVQAAGSHGVSGRRAAVPVSGTGGSQQVLAHPEADQGGAYRGAGAAGLDPGVESRAAASNGVAVAASAASAASARWTSPSWSKSGAVSH